MNRNLVKTPGPSKALEVMVLNVLILVRCLAATTASADGDSEHNRAALHSLRETKYVQQTWPF